MLCASGRRSPRAWGGGASRADPRSHHPAGSIPALLVQPSSQVPSFSFLFTSVLFERLGAGLERSLPKGPMCVLAVPGAHFSDDTACKCPRPPRSAGAPCPLDEVPCPGTVLWEQRPFGSGLVNRPSWCPGSCPILLDPCLLDTMLHPPSANAVLWLLVPDGSPRARPSTRTRGCEVARCPC